MTKDEEVEYRRRVDLREARRREVRRWAGFSDFPGWGRTRRSQFQVNHPEFGGKVAAAPLHHSPYF